MRLKILTHPSTSNSFSMNRVARSIGEGMRNRGHDVSYISSPMCIGRLPLPLRSLKKWMGYIDQFVIFPEILKRHVSKSSSRELFVVADQALGMWVPYIKNQPHVIHCMDFLALKSSLGEFPENPVSWTGKKYQSLIRRGFSFGSNFISISQRTQSDLSRFLPKPPAISEVVYLGLDSVFRRKESHEAMALLPEELLLDSKLGFLMHVGGNAWYKNRSGVLSLYRKWCAISNSKPLPLWLVGHAPNEEMVQSAMGMPNGGKVRFLSNFTDEQVCAAYNLTSAFIFPSLAEGFGWPILEAMACGAPVFTTGEPPMTEVGGDAAFYFPRMNIHDVAEWSTKTAKTLNDYLDSSIEEKEIRRAMGFDQARKFESVGTLDKYEAIYAKILAHNSC